MFYVQSSIELVYTINHYYSNKNCIMKSYLALFLLKTPIHYIIPPLQHRTSGQVHKQHYCYCYSASATEFQHHSDINMITSWTGDKYTLTGIKIPQKYWEREMPFTHSLQTKCFSKKNSADMIWYAECIMYHVSCMCLKLTEV